MKNELIRVEEGQLIIAQNSIEKIKELEIKKKQIDEIKKQYKEQILEIMESNNIKSFESNDKTLKITCTPSGLANVFDTKRFIEEQHDLYLQYLKDTTKKGSIRITVRGDKDE